MPNIGRNDSANARKSRMAPDNVMGSRADCDSRWLAEKRPTKRRRQRVVPTSVPRPV